MARFVLSRRKVLSQYSSVKRIADLVSYSLKTNPEVGMVLERETDCLFSISSPSHIKLVKDKGRIIFFAQGWKPYEIRRLLKIGIRKFTVDNQADLETLKGVMKGRPERVWLFLRMKLKENTIHTGKHFVFGMSAERVNENVLKLANEEWIEKLGVHFHRKTQNISEWRLQDEISESLSEDALKVISVMNIGGGLPSVYKNSRPEIRSIMGSIDNFRKWLARLGISMIVEPGRFIAAPSVRLEAIVKNVYDENLIIDCSVYNSAMDTFIMNTRLMVEGELKEGEGRRYVIKGCTPDSIDIFRYSVWLKEVKVGQKIVFLNAGAYNFASDFDGLKKLKTIVED